MVDTCRHAVEQVSQLQTTGKHDTFRVANKRILAVLFDTNKTQPASPSSNKYNLLEVDQRDTSLKKYRNHGDTEKQTLAHKTHMCQEKIFFFRPFGFLSIGLLIPMT